MKSALCDSIMSLIVSIDYYKWEMCHFNVHALDEQTSKAISLRQMEWTIFMKHGKLFDLNRDKFSN